MSFQKIIHSKLLMAVSIVLAFTLLGFMSLDRLSAAGQQELFRTKATGSREATAPVPASGVLRSLQESFRQVARDVLPTAVEVDVVDVIKQPGQQFSPFDFFFGPKNNQNNKEAPRQREFKQYGLGSGVIVRKDGDKVYVLTNNHVTGSAEEISVKLYDQRQFTAKLVGKDEKKDLALVVFETKEQVPVAQLGDSDTLQVGDIVMAVGNPLGFESSITSGIVSAIGRQSMPGSNIPGFTEYIQTDAAINQGNSGGALVNIDGQVVGINSWIASPSGGNIGLGFAIPINNAKKTIGDLISKGKVEYGWLGISIGNVALQMASDLEIDGQSGGFVFGVFRDSPADKAGILPGDFITQVDGRNVTDANNLLLTVGNLTPGEKVSFELVRYGQKVNLSAKIAARADEKSIAGQAKEFWPGLSVVGITDAMRQQLNISTSAGNVIVGAVEQGSPADLAGLKPGDIIVEVNGTRVKSMHDFYRNFNDHEKKNPMMNILRGNTEVIIGLVR